MSEKSRLTVVESVYHQQPDGTNMPISTQYSRVLKSDEQAFVRKMTVGESWVEVPYGWLQDCSLLVIHNESGKYRTTAPSPQEIEDAEAAVIEVAGPDKVPVFDVPAGESIRGKPRRGLHVRCARGSVKCVVSCIPE